MSDRTWRERISIQLNRKRIELRNQGIADDALEAALREATRPAHTRGYIYSVWCQEVNLMFRPRAVMSPRGKQAAREQELLDAWNTGKPIIGGGRR